MGNMKLENLDMVEGALRLLNALESTGGISTIAAGMVRLDLINSVEAILEDMDKQLNSMMR